MTPGIYLCVNFVCPESRGTSENQIDLIRSERDADPRHCVKNGNRIKVLCRDACHELACMCYPKQIPGHESETGSQSLEVEMDVCVRECVHISRIHSLTSAAAAVAVLMQRDMIHTPAVREETEEKGREKEVPAEKGKRKRRSRWRNGKECGAIGYHTRETDH